MRPLINSADAHASFIEAIRLNRIACVRVNSRGRVRFEPSPNPVNGGGGYHTLPVFDLTQLEEKPPPDHELHDVNGKPTPALMEHTTKVMHFISEQLGKGMLSVPYDDALYLQHNGGGTPIIWVIHLVRTPEMDDLNLLPFRWARREQVWLLESVVAVPLLYGRGRVAVDPYPEDGVTYDAYPQFHHLGDMRRRYDPQRLREHEHEVWVRVMALLHIIQRVMTSRGETVVVEGHEATRVNYRRERLGLPALQPVVRLINLTAPTRWRSDLPSEPTGRTVETHHRRGSIVTNRFGTQFPRRATIVNDPARTPAMSHRLVPKPWYEVWS